ncbi:zinc finger protein 64 homolog [Elysia marginata]|uniref:Zinc finger protein 64 homolog n=1 Tax=Elysia marginata TaxID=1093978 RepID=A0AAV4HAZ6_9GAST|nr:zinc finger protein 64 homolog [Elysia marginata]
MASLNSAQDIHICGICRTEFSDIFQFLKHKKESCSGGLGNVISQSGQLKAQEPIKATNNLPIPMLRSLSNYNLWTSEITPSINFQNQEDSSAYNNKGQPELHEKLTFKNNVQSSNLEETVSFSADHGVEGIKNYAYSNPSSASQNHLESRPIISQSVPHSLLKGETSFQYSLRQQDKKVSTDDIAVYIVSPKSFASSVIKPKIFQNPAYRSSYNVDARQYGSSFYEKDKYSVVDSKHELNECSSVQRDSYHASTAQAILPENSACLYTENSLPSSSDTSTPCPEDLEVGQISASVLGQQPLQAPQNSGRTLISGKNGPVKVGDSSLTSTSVILSGESGTASIATATKHYQPHDESVVSYIRQNTASAPTVVGSSRERIKRKLSVEKRERLQGLSDDLLASSYNAEANFQTNCGLHELQKSACRQSVNASLTNLPKITSFKAVFTSPSRSGHRLSPTQDLIPLSPHGSDISKQMLESSDHAHSIHGSSSSGRTKVYKNISAAVKPQKHLNNSGLGNKLKLSHNEIAKTRTNKGAERQIIFDNSCPKSVAPVTQPTTTFQAFSELDKNVATSQNSECLINPTRTEAANISHPWAGGASAPVTLNLNSVTDCLQASYGFKANPVKIPDNVTGTKTSITTVTAALNQQIPTAVCSSILTESSQIYQGNTTSINVFSRQQPKNNILTGSDTVLVYKNKDASFLIMPENLHRVSSIQQPRVRGFVQQQPIIRKEVLPLSLTNEAVRPMGLQVSDMVQRQQQSQPSEALTACRLMENERSISATSAPSIMMCSQQSKNLSQIIKCNVQSSSQPDLINSAVYSQTSQVASSAFCTVPAVTSTVSSISAPQKQTSGRFLVKNVTTTREPCIIRPKNNSRKQKAPTEKNLGSHIQPQYEINNSGDSNKKERLFLCKFDKCRYSSSLYKDFRRHYRTHTGERPYTCLQCGKTFSRSDKLRIHQRTHDGTKPFQCNFCDYKTLESGSLKKHLRIHTDERPYKCQICPYASRNSSHLVVHLRSHTGDAPFVCSECGAQFRISTDLKRHMRTHTGEKPFKCDLCDYRCAHKGNLKSHMRINHSKEDEMSCDLCDFSTSSRKRLKEHAKIHDPSRSFKCQQCPLTFPTARALRAHLCTHDTVKPYQCSYCPYHCKRSGNLKKHVETQHMDKLQKTPGKNKGKKRTAREAGASSGNKSRAKVRAGVDRPIEYLKQHKCDQCGRGFVRLDSLLSHMNQHKREGQDQVNHSPGFATMTSTADSGVDQTTSTIDTTTRKPTLPVTLRRQGMRHIAAAASKLFEESYANPKQTPGRSEDDFRHKEEQEINSATLSRSTSESVKKRFNIESEPDNELNTVKNHQLPWEHSYTISLPPTPDVECQKGQLCSSLNSVASHQSHTVPSSYNMRPTEPQINNSLEPAMVLQKNSWKISNIIQETADKKPRIPITSNVIYPPAQLNPAIISDHSHQEKQQQQLQLVLRGLPNSVNVQPTQRNATNIELDMARQTFILSQQRDEPKSQETSYNFQLVPQVVTPSQLIRQIVLPSTQVQPATRIQIVLPGATVPDQASSQVISLPDVTQQQVLLQECGMNQVEVLSIPYNQQLLTSTPAQNNKVFQTVTSTGSITLESEQEQGHIQLLQQESKAEERESGKSSDKNVVKCD